jgi:alkylated DNA repair protein alkB family protein 6
MSAAGGPSSSKPLENFRVSSLPPEMYYIPNFISAEEEASVLQKVRCPVC